MIRFGVPHPLTKLRRDWIWPCAVAGVIVWASSRETVATPEFVHWLPSFDKVAHFCVYGLLGTLTLRALGRGRWAPWLAIAVVSLFGATDEWHQSCVPGRSSEALDWVADTLGAALAVSLYAGSDRYRQWLETALVRSATTLNLEQPAR
jgi:VanZ family protein